ncbi:serine/threonine-protein phosphatase 6 regulatory ankyrin repeat subunit A-like [Stylophora pistillata]|uniref:serine/threonine-protein phosphatase 6 regulatory ankyrin repeat subunit A-like n=1 Tax=Stylophora pistillata TaxID=50429 RepID=UPI000C0537EA|nr:serine/threonine-protein phosphatase 6 regulatory ankyrin repeat subunit A-like [Stylophora pistillata]
MQTLFKETGSSIKGKIDGFPYLMFSMPNVQLAKFFIQEGAQVDEKDQQGRTCLFHAIEKALQSASPKSWNVFVYLLLQNGANINSRNDLSETPLPYSLSFRCSRCDLHDALFPISCDASGIQVIEIWRILLEAKARPNVKDEKDRSLLHFLLFLLQKKYLGVSEGFQIVCNGTSTLKGFEINSRDTEGNTALHMWANLMRVAVSDETIKIGIEIVSHGGAANSRNDKGDTPFHVLIEGTVFAGRLGRIRSI